MTLKNVEKIEQENHKKSWFQRFRNKIGIAASAVTSLAVSSAHALKTTDVQAAYTASGATETIDGTGIIIIGLVISLAVIGIIISLVKKK
ncbi:hypothetical protein F938_02054 [Acinetobacter bereziniae LMG 1003 = CIP 70.12]|uniref:Uncharacterized protein n=1 Tax=Acinetobacter bereziniae LMG 1003 = CIP 70.12 TaxID=981324 RepID=N9EV91_ACIBZ|nr:major capsid protein [Acinetobacter bereziniae]ENV96650.1 hypothetical protein F938_02054 [Acinetobacter bereziniae LMG 1003 = CIP 70.12]